VSVPVVEPEAVLDVLPAVTRVVHLDRVAGAIGEAVEVRASGRLLHGDVVGDERRSGRLVRAGEGVDVRVVRRGVLADRGGLAMARAGREGGYDGRRRGDGR